MLFQCRQSLIIESAVDCDLLMDKTKRNSFEYKEEEFSETEKVEKEYSNYSPPTNIGH